MRPVPAERRAARRFVIQCGRGLAHVELARTKELFLLCL